MRKRGEADAFLRSLVGTTETACMAWPYLLNSSGYGYVYLRKKCITANRRLCALAYGEPTFDRAEAAHSCGNRACVNPNHLRWATKAENCADRLRHGTDHRADKSPCAKLTWDDVRVIRSSAEVAEKIAPKFGVTPKHIRRIRAGERWTDPTQEARDVV
jgi:hypothetical protein